MIGLPTTARRAVATFALAIGGTLATAPLASAGTPAGDPPYSVPVDELDAALDCDEFTHPDKEPVLLVHGTFTAGHEQWDWNYAILLRETGHDVCIVTYPDRGFGDQQISAEYVARAVQRIHAESGRKVDMIGHSQGASMPRWAIKWWPSVQAALDDFVLLAGPVHGTSVASGSLPTGQPPAFFQFSPSSNFIQALNEGDETPGPISYTSIYTRYDELVQPVDPPTAELDPGIDDPAVANILLQDVCPGNLADHLTIGTIDRLTQILTLDAIDNAGPTDLRRVDVDAVLCALEGLYVVPETFPALAEQFQRSMEGGFPGFETVTEEPPLRDYARPTSITPESSTTLGAATGDSPAAAPDATTQSVARAESESSGGLAATGRAIPVLAVLIAVGVALLLRAGRSKLAAPADTNGDATTDDPPDD